MDNGQGNTATTEGRPQHPSTLVSYEVNVMRERMGADEETVTEKEVMKKRWMGRGQAEDDG